MIKLKLAEMLEQRKMSAYALHIKSGLHQSVISKIKRNMSKALQLDVLDTLCEALECSPCDLIVRENPNATQYVNTQSVKPTQSVKTTTQNVNDTWAQVQAAKKATKEKKPKQESLPDEDFAPSNSSDNDKHFYSASRIVSGESVAGMLTLQQVAERLGVSRKSVNDYVVKGKLKATKGKQNHNFVSEADLDEYVRQLKV